MIGGPLYCFTNRIPVERIEVPFEGIGIRAQYAIPALERLDLYLDLCLAYSAQKNLIDSQAALLTNLSVSGSNYALEVGVLKKLNDEIRTASEAKLKSERFKFFAIGFAAGGGLVAVLSVASVIFALNVKSLRQ